jgi:hypothetical protein
MTMEHPRVTLDPAVLAGKPVVRGTRLSVEFIIGLLAADWTEADSAPSMKLHMTTSLRATPMHAMFISEKVFPGPA